MHLNTSGGKLLPKEITDAFESWDLLKFFFLKLAEEYAGKALYLLHVPVKNFRNWAEELSSSGNWVKDNEYNSVYIYCVRIDEFSPD